MRHSAGVSALHLIGLLAALAFLSASQCASGESAASDYKKGRLSEERGDIIAAYRAYKAAFDLVPNELKYRSTYERVRNLASIEYVKQGDRFLHDGNLPAALAAFLKALDIDPANEVAEADTRKVQQA